MTGSRLALVAEDQRLAASIQAHLKKALGQPALHSTLQTIRSHLGRETDSVLLLVAASENDCEPVLRLVQEIYLQKLPIITFLVEGPDLPPASELTQLIPYVAQRLPTLMVDPILIEQVVLNLLKNAAEAIDAAHMPPSRRNIELRVVPRHTPEEGGVIEFSVTDMGPGIKDEVIARLYEAFFSTKAEGLGIGLSLCRSIIESHRGRIRAQNLYNGASVVGCSFTFTLPVDVPRTEALSTSNSAVTS